VGKFVVSAVVFDNFAESCFFQQNVVKEPKLKNCKIRLSKIFDGILFLSFINSKRNK